MNAVRGTINLVAAVLVALTLIGFVAGIYYPSKALMVLTMLVTIGVLLNWSSGDFEKNGGDSNGSYTKQR